MGDQGWDASNVEADLREAQRLLQLHCARLLVCMPTQADVREGVRLLTHVVKSGHNRAEAMEYLSVAHLKLGDYRQARHCAETLLRLKPKDGAGRILHSLVIQQAVRDGLPVVLLTVGTVLGISAITWLSR